MKFRIGHSALALFTAASIAVAPLAGCGNDRADATRRNDIPAPVDDSRGPARNEPAQGQQASPGMSTTKKVVILAGAAALYYLYKHHQAAAANANGAAVAGQEQYYLSKNGRVYYRDAEHRAHWVTPPAQGIQVPESEAQEYRQFQGYGNRTEGRDLSGMGNDEQPQER